MKKIFPLFILLFAFSAAAQIEEPIAGKLNEIKGFTKVCIVAKTKNIRGAMIDALKKEKSKIEVVEAKDAQFFLELNTSDRKRGRQSARKCADANIHQRFGGQKTNRNI